MPYFLVGLLLLLAVGAVPGVGQVPAPAPAACESCALDLQTALQRHMQCQADNIQTYMAQVRVLTQALQQLTHERDALKSRLETPMLPAAPKE